MHPPKKGVFDSSSAKGYSSSQPELKELQPFDCGSAEEDNDLGIEVCTKLCSKAMPQKTFDFYKKDVVEKISI